LLIEVLDQVEAAIDLATTRTSPRTRGGRPRDLEATWLVEQVVDTLTRHGVKVTAHEDRVCANVVRTLWTYALPHREAPIELRPWFKLLKFQR
jgi:hypothetical protein